MFPCRSVATASSEMDLPAETSNSSLRTSTDAKGPTPRFTDALPVPDLPSLSNSASMAAGYSPSGPDADRTPPSLIVPTTGATFQVISAFGTGLPSSS